MSTAVPEPPREPETRFGRCRQCRKRVFVKVLHPRHERPYVVSTAVARDDALASIGLPVGGADCPHDGCDANLDWMADAEVKEASDGQG